MNEAARHVHLLDELAAALTRAADRLRSGDETALGELGPKELTTMHTILVSYGMAMDLMESVIEPMEES